MKKNPVFCLCGASGTGKSTILDHIKEFYPIDTEEVSARPFLPKDMDYVNSLDEKSQTLITQHRFISILEGLFKTKPIVYSRSPIDSLAYELTLNKAPYLISLLERQIDISKEFVIYIYLPVEFEMNSADDIVRGTNNEVQKNTDSAIQKILMEKIPYWYCLSGSKQERFLSLKEILRKYNVTGNYDV
jgi:hypothetical protein